MHTLDSPSPGEPIDPSVSFVPPSDGPGYLAPFTAVDVGAGAVYAVGRIEPRFPSIAVEKEFAQLVGRADPTKRAGYDLMRDILTDPDNRYLARRVCWVFTAN